MERPIDFQKLKNVYIIGIKGSGTVALAELLVGWGVPVSGSDVQERFFTDEILERLGIVVHQGFSTEHIRSAPDIDLVIYSTAYTPERNEELAWAMQQGIPCASYPEVLSQLMQQKFGIAVCGTHGKTTTTAMLALAMRSAGADPTAIIGSRLHQTGGSALVGHSQYFILEADEYQNKFLQYHPMAVVLTSVDYDHPDFFPDETAYRQTFIDFVKKIPSHGFLVVWGGSVSTLAVAKEAKCKVIVYGDFDFTGSAALVTNQIRDDFAKTGKRNISFFSTPGTLALQLPGRHNRWNATAVLAVCQEFGFDLAAVQKSVEQFQGTARRFEYLGQHNGAVIIDDYAHHPEEITVTLQAARAKYPEKKIICVFHPHTYTRTQALLDQFAQSFDDADHVIVLDIYGSAREKQGTIHARDLVEKMQRYHQSVEYIADIESVYQHMKDRMGQNDVIITMGAGNVNELGMKLAGKLIDSGSKR